MNDQQKWEAYLKGLKSCNRYDRAVQKYLNWAKIEKISWDDPFHCDLLCSTYRTYVLYEEPINDLLNYTVELLNFSKKSCTGFLRNQIKSYHLEVRVFYLLFAYLLKKKVQQFTLITSIGAVNAFSLEHISLLPSSILLLGLKFHLKSLQLNESWTERSTAAKMPWRSGH